MASVWVIEQGSYSDYGVCGVFTTKESADMVAAAMNNGDPYEPATVAEWPLDPGVEEMRAGLARFSLRMNRDGDTKDINAVAHGYGPSEFIYGEPWKLGSFWGRDEAHAVKVANEHRTRLIAAGEWK
jgi:hypothetical protein